MSEIIGSSELLPHIPDDLTVPQFMFEYCADSRPTRDEDIPWLIEDETGRRISQSEIKKRTFGLANGLSSKYGIGENDVVVIFSRNHVDYPVVLWAVHTLGGIISGANPDFSVGELVYQLTATKASAIFVHPDFLQVALEAGREAGVHADRIILFNGLSAGSTPDLNRVTIQDLVEHGHFIEPCFVERRLAPGEARTKLALMSFSSGTTGKPKAVAIPHYSLIANVIQLAVHNKTNKNYTEWKDQRYRPGDVGIGVLPLYHIYGLVVNLHFLLYAGMSVVIVSKFNFVGMLESIVRHRISHLMLVPPQIVLICKHPATKSYDLKPYVRMIMSGAAPLSSEMNQQLFKMFPDAQIGQAYGMTETCTAVSMWGLDQKRGHSGSAGRLMPGVVARVVKQDGTLAGYDEVGELVIKAPSLAIGYANNAQATKETFVDGWVVTGDEVRIDRTGELWILDRLKEIMKVKGFQVAPAELEGCLLDHPDVSNACVVGIPDDYSGEVPIAFVVLAAEASKRVKDDSAMSVKVKTSIIKHVADNKVAYKHLAGGVEFVDVIPTSPSGKLLRRVLRDKAKEMRKKPTPVDVTAGTMVSGGATSLPVQAQSVGGAIRAKL